MIRKPLYTLILLLLGSLAYAQTDSVTVIGSRHGYMSGQTRRTLATIVLPKSGRIDISYRLDPRTTRLIERCEVLASDSLVVRDLDDYKGRVAYDAIPLSGKERARLTTDKRVLYLTADVESPLPHRRRGC